MLRRIISPIIIRTHSLGKQGFIFLAYGMWPPPTLPIPCKHSRPNKFVRDTVSSLGHLRSKDLPKTVDGEDHICVFRHALALDERRVKFLPEYCYGGAPPLGSGNNTASRTSFIPKVKETWFRGSHPDMWVLINEWTWMTALTPPTAVAGNTTLVQCQSQTTPLFDGWHMRRPGRG